MPDARHAARVHPSRRRRLRRRASGALRRRAPAVAYAAGLLAAIVAAVLLVVLLSGGHSRRSRACIDPGPTRSDLLAADHAIGHRFGCVVLFDDAASTWAQWDDPWFLTDPSPDDRWAGFARQPGRLLVLTVNMFPSSVNDEDWRSAGADGAYAGYARRLARNLVAAGMGRSVIRLGHEANGTWYADDVGTTSQTEAQWREFWRRTVQAMRSVPGARFSFDWCVSAGIRPLALRSYYPGDDVVDSIGFDVYDSGVPSGVTDRWGWLSARPEGVAAIAAFARQHHKPLAIPEWGLQPRSVPGGGGRDPGFVRGIANEIDSHDVTFESYFFHEGGQTALLGDPESLQIYRRRILR